MARVTLPDEWVDDHGDAMYRFALSRICDESVVEDLLQETFLAALKARDSFNGESTLRTWLIGILRRKIVDWFRAQARNKIHAANSERIDHQQFRTTRLKSWDARPEASHEREEFWQAFNGCVGKLPPTLASAYLMREVDGCSTEEICGMLDISSRNLATRIFRARCLLRDCLDANWFSE